MKIQPITNIPSLSQRDPKKVVPINKEKQKAEETFKLELDKAMQKRIQDKNPNPIFES